MPFVFLLILLGIFVFQQDEFQVTRDRKLDKSISRLVGFVMLIGAGLSFVFGDWIGHLSLVVAITVVFTMSEPIVR